MKRVICSLLSFAMAAAHVHGWLISTMRKPFSRMRDEDMSTSGLDPQDWELVSEIVED